MPLLAGIEELAPLLVYLLFFLGPLILRAILRGSGEKDPDGSTPAAPPARPRSTGPTGPTGPSSRTQPAGEEGTDIWRRLLRGEPIVARGEPPQEPPVREQPVLAEPERVPAPPPPAPRTARPSLVTLESGELHDSLPSEVRREPLRTPLPTGAVVEDDVALGGELAGDSFGKPLRAAQRRTPGEAPIPDAPQRLELGLDRGALRRAILWREVLSAPVSLRGAEEPGSPEHLG